MMTTVAAAKTASAAAPDYLPALTGLRFALAIWVILHHIYGQGIVPGAWAHSLPGPILMILQGGYLAVQTFFVLSGFVLARTYERTVWNRRSLGRFFTARVARIYPVYFVSLIVLSPFIIRMILAPAWAAQRVRLLTDYLFVLQGWVPSLNVGWNTPAWSLSCEFFFYLWFPVLFMLLRNVRWKGIAIAMTVAILLPIALSHAGVPWYWKPIYHMGDFVAGIAAARIFALLAGARNAPGWRRHGYRLYLPALALGGWLVVYPTVVNGTGADLNTWLRPLNVALLVGFALDGGWLARWLSTGAADFLGKASYSMYVLHVPILWWYERYYVFGKLELASPFYVVIYLALVVTASGLVFHYFEAPASSWIRAQQKKLERQTDRPSTSKATE